MDHHGRLRLISLLRILAPHIESVRIKKAEGTKEWQWANEMLVFPDNVCTECKKKVRSTAVWAIRPAERRLIGQIVIGKGKKFKLESPTHPHLTTNAGHLCFGNAKNIYELIGSMPNKPGMAQHYNLLPMWYKTYYNHECEGLKKMRQEYGEP